MDSDALEELPERPEAARRIYAYRLNLDELSGRFKVGETKRAVALRVSEQVKTAGLADVLDIVMDRPAITRDGRPFRDSDVHRALLGRGIERPSHVGGVEWFLCSVAEVEAAYIDVFEGRQHTGVRDKNFKMRDEQRRAVAETFAYYTLSPTKPRYLWNAKMRFGKTFAALQLAKQLQARRVLITTYKPAVADAWEDDVKTHVDFDGWHYWSSAGPALDPPSAEEVLVAFVSLQYLRHHRANGSGAADWIFDERWDLVIVDEYHFGAWRRSTAELLSADGGADLVEEGFADEEDGRLIESRFPSLDGQRYLYLSGTPFRAIASRDFDQHQIFNWTYSDEQRAKREFEPQQEGDENPYIALPEMRLLTYQLPATIGAVARRGERNEFDLNTFFETRGTGVGARFVREDDVQGWLDWLHGEDVEAAVATMAHNERPFPFRHLRLLAYLNHSVWFLPSVASVHAMKAMLTDPANTFWHQFDVLPVAGSSAGVGLSALKPVRDKIGAGVDSKTITLTCGKLLTGVTVPQWSAMLMLCNLSAPETYFQAAFRVQSAWAIRNPNGDDPSELQIRKPACLVIDFAPNRALRQHAEYGARLGSGVDPEADVADLARNLPVMAFDGASLRTLDPAEIFDQVLRDAPIDVRQMDSARFVSSSPTALHALTDDLQQGVAQLPGLRRPTPGQGGTTDVNDDPDVHGPAGLAGGTDDDDTDESEDSEPVQSYSEADLAARLMFVVKRLRAFMYVSDERERSLEDILNTPEVELFQKFVGLSPAQVRRVGVCRASRWDTYQLFNGSVPSR